MEEIEVEILKELNYGTIIVAAITGGLLGREGLGPSDWKMWAILLPVIITTTVIETLIKNKISQRKEMRSQGVKDDRTSTHDRERGYAMATVRIMGNSMDRTLKVFKENGEEITGVQRIEIDAQTVPMIYVHCCYELAEVCIMGEAEIERPEPSGQITESEVL